MRDHSGKIIEISITPLHQVIVNVPTGLGFNLGQYFLLSQNGSNKPAAERRRIFPTEVGPNLYTFLHPNLEDLYPGEVVFLFGPIGKGLQLGMGTNKLLYVSYTSENLLLAGLTQYIKHPRQNLTVVTKTEMAGLTGERIKYGNHKELVDLLMECEICILEINCLNDYETFKTACGDNWGNLQEKVKIFMAGVDACHATGNCGLCSIDFEGKKILLCKDGPFFNGIP